MLKLAEWLMRCAYAIAAHSADEDAGMLCEAVAVYFQRWRGVRPVKTEQRYYA